MFESQCRALYSVRYQGESVGWKTQAECSAVLGIVSANNVVFQMRSKDLCHLYHPRIFLPLS